jgi:hypothetical protein
VPDVLIAAAVDQRVLQVHDAREQQALLQRLALRGIRRQTEEQTVALLAVAFGDRPAEAIESFIGAAAGDRIVLLEIDLRRAPRGSIEAIDTRLGSRRSIVALLLIARVMARKLADDLVPDVEALRDVPHGLHRGQHGAARLHARVECDGAAPTEDRVVVVDAA